MTSNRRIFSAAPFIAALALTACGQSAEGEAATIAASADSTAPTASAAQSDTLADTPTDPSAPIAVGSAAPLFTTEGALAGKPFTLDLAAELKNGPVVLYFFPAAFTAGCTLESKEFADRNKDFEAAGAKVFGLSGDDVETLSRFSREACRDEFAVARAGDDIIKGYGVSLGEDSPLTSRTSFVIAQDGTVAMVHDDGNYRDHVRLTYEAVEQLKAG